MKRTLLIPLLLTFSPFSCQEYSVTPLKLGDVAVVTGDYDSIQTVLDWFEVPYTPYDGYINGSVEGEGSIPENSVESLLMNPNLLNTYELLFINCGARGMGNIDPVGFETDDHLIEDEGIINNIIDFVEGGGYLYVSDWAYDILERAFPDWINFSGHDAEPDSAQLGKAGLISAIIHDEKLKEKTGKVTVEINLNYDAWALAESTRGEVMVSGNVTYFSDYPGTEEMESAPLLIHFDQGKGKVFYTSFHYENDATQDTLDILYYLMFEFEREEGA